MMKKYFMRILLSVVLCFSFYQETLAQTINLNERFIQQNLRTGGVFKPWLVEGDSR